jgi:hypothetical protein
VRRISLGEERGPARARGLSAVLSPERITLGPLDMSQFIPGMRVAWIADPERNIVELNQGYVDEESPPPLPAE